MRRLLIFILLFSSSLGFTQNPKKLLSKDELVILDSTGVIIKEINNSNNDYVRGFTGNLLIKKIKNQYKSIEIGKWIRNQSKYGPYTVMNWDSTGELLDYKEYNLDKSVGFDCTYRYDSINGKYYRLEDMISANETGVILTKGHRYWLIKKDKFGFYKLSKKKKFGSWKIYDDKGNLIRNINYGEIK